MSPITNTTEKKEKKTFIYLCVCFYRPVSRGSFPCLGPGIGFLSVGAYSWWQWRRPAPNASDAIPPRLPRPGGAGLITAAGGLFCPEQTHWCWRNVSPTNYLMCLSFSNCWCVCVCVCAKSCDVGQRQVVVDTHSLHSLRHTHTLTSLLSHTHTHTHTQWTGLLLQLASCLSFRP